MVGGHGYFSGPINFSENLEKKLARLRNQDKEEWAKLLGGHIGSPYFSELKKLSPFAGKILIYVDYGMGFVEIFGDMENWVNALIRGKKNWKTHDCDDYLVALPKPDEKDAEVFWLRCGISGVNGPRSNKDR